MKASGQHQVLVPSPWERTLMRNEHEESQDQENRTVLLHCPSQITQTGRWLNHDQKTRKNPLYLISRQSKLLPNKCRLALGPGQLGFWLTTRLHLQSKLNFHMNVGAVVLPFALKNTTPLHTATL
jgi:hypothetical protein